MATVRAGKQSVLLVVDVQVGVVQEAWESPRIIENVVQAVDRARAAGIPVLWVQHSGDDLPKDSPNWQLVPALHPAADEPVLHKRYESSFEETTLEDELARLGATHIVLAGAATNWCIRATAYAALNRGYDLTLVSDAHTTETIEFENGPRIEAANIIQELNIVLRWISFPGRKSSVATAATLEFA